MGARSTARSVGSQKSRASRGELGQVAVPMQEDAKCCVAQRHVAKALHGARSLGFGAGALDVSARVVFSAPLGRFSCREPTEMLPGGKGMGWLVQTAVVGNFWTCCSL